MLRQICWAFRKNGIADLGNVDSGSMFCGVDTTLNIKSYFRILNISVSNMFLLMAHEYECSLRVFLLSAYTKKANR